MQVKRSELHDKEKQLKKKPQTSKGQSYWPWLYVKKKIEGP